MQYLSIRITTVLCLFVSSFVNLPARLQGSESGWKVGIAAAKVTPEEPVRMAGYASRQSPSEGIASDLFAKAMAFEDGAQHRAVMVTCDVIGFTKAFAEPMCRRISEQTGLQRQQILLNASHTHTGPILALDAGDLDFPAEQAAATVRYSQQLQDTIVRLVAESLEDLQPATLSWGVGVARFPMNRREFTERGVILGVNPRGLCDRSVPILKVAAGEKTRAVLFGAACHNTTLGGRDMKISGDFAGYAQASIEGALPGTQAMFMQGCAGDANPFPRGSEEIARLHGASLGEEVLRVLQTDLQPVRGPLRALLEPVAMPLAHQMSRDEIEEFGKLRGGWRSFVVSRMLETLDRGDALSSDYTSEIAVWQFGDDLTLVALPGEVVVDYVAHLEKAIGPRKLWIAAYSNDVFGYLPSARTLVEGGYETRGLYSGGIGLFSPDAERVVVEKVHELAVRAGREID